MAKTTGGTDQDETEEPKTNGSSVATELKAGAAESAATPLPVGAATQSRAQPVMRVLRQYLKDFSFENPNSPQSLQIQQGQPEINIQVNVNAKPVAATDFEVELHLEAKASHQGKVMFAADLLYGGLFRLENIPQEALHPVILVECPRMLFPFARQILADATQNGGFPPLMLDPIDFAGMYQKRLQESRASA
jgi:preprotein translocase subunit SecB